MERKHIIPLRKEFLKVPIYLRTRKAVKTVKKYISRHMKTEDVRIGKYLNLKLWSRGNRNPPHKVEVIAELVTDKKDNKEIKYAKVEIVGAPKEVKKETKKKKLLDRLKDKVEGKEVVADKAIEKNKELADEVKEEKKEAEKVIRKEQEKLMESKKAPKKVAAPKKTKKEEVGIEMHADQFQKDNKK